MKTLLGNDDRYHKILSVVKVIKNKSKVIDI